MMDILTSNVRATLAFRCRTGQDRPQCRPWTDMTLPGTRITRSKPMDGTSVGNWSATFKVTYQSPQWEFLHGTLRDGDWVEIAFDDGRHRSTMLGIVEAINAPEDIADGAVERTVTVQGSDWAKAMTGPVRCTYMLEPMPGEEALFLDSGMDSLSEESLALIGAGPMSVPGARLYPRIPGIIDTPIWQRLMETLGEAASTPAPTLLERVARTMLWGQYRTADGETILFKLGRDWRRFGSFAGIEIAGCPWQAVQFLPTTSSTPEGFLRAYCNPAFNELFYEYDDSDRRQPAIVFRERPYSGTAWASLVASAMRLDDRCKLRLNLTRSGVERINYVMPVATKAGLVGQDRFVDDDTGYLPLIDRSQIPTHGLRIAEPRDDYDPPQAREDANALRYYMRRAETFRDWHYYAGEYLTGTVTCIPAQPAARIGTCARVPTHRIFRQQPGDTRIAVNEIVAYIVGVQDTAVIGEGGVIQTSTTLTVIRGQPVDGLLLPNLESWRTP